MHNKKKQFRKMSVIINAFIHTAHIIVLLMPYFHFKFLSNFY